MTWVDPAKTRKLTQAPLLARCAALLVCLTEPTAGQLPFYTDDPAVTAPGKWHFEFFNEYDVLQLQSPNIRQNTANGKLNYGLPHNLELDVDYPYLAIFRTVGNPNSVGGGDLNLGSGAQRPEPDLRHAWRQIGEPADRPSGRACRGLSRVTCHTSNRVIAWFDTELKCRIRITAAPHILKCG